SCGAPARTRAPPARNTPPPFPTRRSSDLVWNDTNANGIQDVGEVGIGNVTVRLLDSTGTTVLATTTTNGGGMYSFTGLAAGSYRSEDLTPELLSLNPLVYRALHADDSEAN